MMDERELRRAVEAMSFGSVTYWLARVGLIWSLGLIGCAVGLALYHHG